MAKEVVEAFPQTPSKIIIPSCKRSLTELRKDMAVTILQASGMFCIHPSIRMLNFEQFKEKTDL